MALRSKCKGVQRQKHRPSRRRGSLADELSGYCGKDSLKKISWDEFFDKFGEKGLSFLYQEKTASGRPSRFFKFVARDASKAKGRGK